MRRTSSGKRRFGDRNPVLDENLGLIEIGSKLEGDGQCHRPIGGRIGGHVEHVLDAVDFLFKRRGNSIGDRFGIGAGIRCPDDDGGWSDLWILRDRQLEISDATDNQKDDRQNRCEDRPVNEEMSKSHWPFSVVAAASGGRTTSLGSTITPGRSRVRPLTTSVSSPFRPSRMTR